MRANRLLSIMLLLQVHRRMTARDLAKRLEVSERTIHRDMEALGEAGIPVFAERGTGGGWCLQEAYRTNLTGLNEDEIQALFLAQPQRLLEDLGLRKASEAAFVKMLAALPSMRRRDAQEMRQRIHIDSAGWKRQEEAIPFLAQVQEAVWQERKLRFVYRRSDAVLVERVADPLGLVAKGSIWYLVASVEGELRSYRVSRLLDAQVLDELCARPAGFDLAAYWAESSTSFQANLPRYPVRVRADAAILPALRPALRYGRIERVEPPAEDGWQVVCILFEVEAEALEYLLVFGDRIEVLEPEVLRERLVAHARGIVDFYASKMPAVCGECVK